MVKTSTDCVFAVHGGDRATSPSGKHHKDDIDQVSSFVSCAGSHFHRYMNFSRTLILSSLLEGVTWFATRKRKILKVSLIQAYSEYHSYRKTLEENHVAFFF